MSFHDCDMCPESGHYTVFYIRASEDARLYGIVRSHQHGILAIFVVEVALEPVLLSILYVEVPYSRIAVRRHYQIVHHLVVQLNIISKENQTSQSM